MTEAEKRAFAAGIEAAVEKISARVDELKQQQEDAVSSDTLDGYGSGLLDEAEGLLEEIRALIEQENGQ